jgi:putative hydrolase of the HAD superfamily
MIKHLLFDLDNTLYSARYGLEHRVSRRIDRFIAELLGVSPEEAETDRRGLLKNYGTTLEWLMAEKGFSDVEGYYRVIHPGDEAEGLPPDPELGEYLAGIPLPKAVLTNSPREHAERVLSRLGIGGQFTHVFDIRFNRFKGKPDREAFLRALEAMGAEADSTLFVDDYPEYLEGYLALGGRALLLDEFDRHRRARFDRIRNLRELSGFLDCASA